MRTKRAQLSVETMIIYGLVILVTLSVIGGLLYFNVLDLGSYLPDKCVLGGTGDLKCEEMKFGSGTLEIGVRNIGQKPVESLSITVTDDEGVHFSTSATGTATVNSNPISSTNTLAPGDIALVSISTGGSNSGKLLRGTLVTSFMYRDGVVTQDAVGSIRIKAS